jgi:hypothetical protein
VFIANPCALQAVVRTVATLAGDKENRSDVFVESNAGVAVSPPLFCRILLFTIALNHINKDDNKDYVCIKKNSNDHGN